MSLEPVLKEIEAETQEKEKQTLAEAEKSAKKVLAEAQAKAEEILKSAEAQAKAEAELQRKKELQAVQLGHEKKALAMRREVLEEILEGTRKKIREMDVGERGKLLARLLQNAKKELPEASSYRCNAEDRKLFEKMKTGLAFDGEADMLGGIILLTKDQSVRSNQSFEEILEKIREENLAAISSRVFGQNR